MAMIWEIYIYIFIYLGISDVVGFLFINQCMIFLFKITKLCLQTMINQSKLTHFKKESGLPNVGRAATHKSLTSAIPLLPPADTLSC